MSKRMKRFVSNSAVTALVFGGVTTFYDQIGPLVVGVYFDLIWWGIFFVLFAILTFIVSRFCVGIQNGYLLFDDTDE